MESHATKIALGVWTALVVAFLWIPLVIIALWASTRIGSARRRLRYSVICCSEILLRLL